MPMPFRRVVVLRSSVDNESPEPTDIPEPAMPAAKTETKAPAANPALPGKQVRKLQDVAAEIRRLREEEKLSTQEIHEALQVSFDVINQLFLQSYKMTMNTGDVFEAQEKLRLGL
jgi:ribosome-binding protein aMBF1 (putative translation factor)